MEENNKPIEQQEAQAGVEETKTAEKMFSQSELNAILEKRLAKEREKFDKKITQAEKMAEMSATEREAEKIRIAQENLENSKAEMEKMKLEFEQQRLEFEKSQMLAETQKQLGIKGLPIEMASQLVAENAELTLKNIEVFEKTFNECLQKAVDERLKSSSSSPKVEIRANEGAKDVKDMSLSEFIAYKKSQED